MALFTCSIIPPLHDKRSCNKIIKEQLLNGYPRQTIITYLNMQQTGFTADNFTFPILLKAVGSLSFCDTGSALHGQTIKTGYLDHVFVQTALLNMYSSICCINNARKVFEKMSVKDLVAWNSMLDAYVSCDQMDNAIALFGSMPSKDLLSFNIMISGYASGGKITCAKRVFDMVPGKDIVSWNSMIMACANAGDMKEARNLFVKMPERNIITWNTMINGYLHSKLYIEAVELFNEMKAGNLEPDYLTVTGVLSACAHLGSLETGREVHLYAQNHGLISSTHVTTSLIDMYAKCGSLQCALKVYYKSLWKDIFCWNAMICGLALHGFGYAALELFDKMKDTSIKPDDITFIGLLSACSHSGLVQEGCLLFDHMEKEFGISPKLEHYGCIIDLLGRARFLDSAIQVMESMPFKPGESIFGALLNACVVHRDLENGKKVAKLMSARDCCMSDGEFMMLANLYASCSQWEEANKWRDLMNNAGIVKTAGCSVIEVNGRYFKFLAGEIAACSMW